VLFRSNVKVTIRLSGLSLDEVLSGKLVLQFAGSERVICETLPAFEAEAPDGKVVTKIKGGSEIRAFWRNGKLYKAELMGSPRKVPADIAEFREHMQAEKAAYWRKVHTGDAINLDASADLEMAIYRGLCRLCAAIPDGDPRKVQVMEEARIHRGNAEAMTWQAANLRRAEYPADPRVGKATVPSSGCEDFLAQQRIKELGIEL